MLKVIIVEDELMAAEFLAKRLVKQDCQVLGIFSKLEDLIQMLANNHSDDIDIIFLDIHLSDANGFDIFAMDFSLPQMILTTAYNNYAIKAFDANCCDYLLKPFSDERLGQAINKARLNNSKQTVSCAHHQKAKTRLVVKRGATTFPVNVTDIAYVYKSALLNLVTTTGKNYVHEATLDDLMKQLGTKCFFRINRQWIININAVVSFTSFENNKLLLHLQPCSELQVVVSQGQVKNFKLWLSK